MYANPALFLVLESMGGTWMTALEEFTRSVRLDDTTIELLIYDLRQWDSIENENKVDIKHVSPHYMNFMKAFGLVYERAAVTIQYRPKVVPLRKPSRPAAGEGASGQGRRVRMPPKAKGGAGSSVPSAEPGEAGSAKSNARTPAAGRRGGGKGEEQEDAGSPKAKATARNFASQLDSDEEEV
jgi:hypothetical protein